MQDPSPAFLPPALPEMERLKCPRCESTNTKFCYYNNYNLSQPRHFCKNCRRYWTKGGSLRNIPVGGGTRSKPAAKRPKPDRSTPGSAEPLQPPPPPNPPIPGPNQVAEPRSGVFLGLNIDPERRQLDAGSSFSSPLASNHRFRAVMEHPNDSDPNMNSSLGLSPAIDHSPNGGPELGYLSLRHGFNGDRNGGEEAGCRGNSRDWPNLSIFSSCSRNQ